MIWQHVIFDCQPAPLPPPPDRRHYAVPYVFKFQGKILTFSQRIITKINFVFNFRWNFFFMFLIFFSPFMLKQVLCFLNTLRIFGNMKHILKWAVYRMARTIYRVEWPIYGVARTSYKVQWPIYGTAWTIYRVAWTIERMERKTWSRVALQIYSTTWTINIRAWTIYRVAWTIYRVGWPI